MSDDPGQEFFSHGISEEILNVLASIDQLHVASRTSAFTYQDRILSIPEIATELGVNFVLEGSVRKAGDNVRITAQLIGAANDRHLWSDTYDRSLEDIFAIQSEIASAIGNALLTPMGLESAPVVPAATTNLSAYELYLKGREIFTTRSPKVDIAVGIAYLEKSVELDPGFVEAYQYLAAIYGIAPYWGVDDKPLETYLALARETIDKTIAMAPANAFAYAIRG
jgi:TolB-like protein